MADVSEAFRFLISSLFLHRRVSSSCIGWCPSLNEIILHPFVVLGNVLLMSTDRPPSVLILARAGRGYIFAWSYEESSFGLCFDLSVASSSLELTTSGSLSIGEAEKNDSEPKSMAECSGW